MLLCEGRDIMHGGLTIESYSIFKLVFYGSLFVEVSVKEFHVGHFQLRLYRCMIKINLSRIF